MTKNARMLTTAEAAKVVGVKTATLRSYRCRQMPVPFPEPDAYIGVTPVWKISTLRAWLKVKPGLGRPPGS